MPNIAEIEERVTRKSRVLRSSMRSRTSKAPGLGGNTRLKLSCVCDVNNLSWRKPDRSTHPPRGADKLLNMAVISLSDVASAATGWRVRSDKSKR